jgi:dTDP-4-dehydrorhamnose 3,5-epimerase
MFQKLEGVGEKYSDERGYLEVIYEKDDVVLKRSFSKAGVFRGMHYQEIPFQQTKIIRVISGEIIDFVADVKNKNNGIEYKNICAQDGWVQIRPELAHGFLALQDTLFEYFCIGKYNIKSEKSYSIVKYVENKLGVKNLLLSDKDKIAPALWGGDFNI